MITFISEFVEMQKRIDEEDMSQNSVYTVMKTVLIMCALLDMPKYMHERDMINMM